MDAGRVSGGPLGDPHPWPGANDRAAGNGRRASPVGPELATSQLLAVSFMRNTGRHAIPPLQSSWAAFRQALADHSKGLFRSGLRSCLYPYSDLHPGLELRESVGGTRAAVRAPFGQQRRGHVALAGGGHPAPCGTERSADCGNAGVVVIRGRSWDVASTASMPAAAPG